MHSVLSHEMKSQGVQIGIFFGTVTLCGGIVEIAVHLPNGQ